MDTILEKLEFTFEKEVEKIVDEDKYVGHDSIYDISQELVDKLPVSDRIKIFLEEPTTFNKIESGKIIEDEDLIDLLTLNIVNHLDSIYIYEIAKINDWEII